MMSSNPLGPFSLERMVRAVQKVRERLLSATAALERADVPYAVVGNQGTAAWVSRVDESAVRYSQEIDVLVRKEDVERAASALVESGLALSPDLDGRRFLDGKERKPRDSVRLLFAGEKVSPSDPLPAPDLRETEPFPNYQVAPLDVLLRLSLTTFRRTDRVDVRDLIDVGLVDASWVPRLPVELAARLQHLLDTPGG